MQWKECEGTEGQLQRERGTMNNGGSEMRVEKEQHEPGGS